MTRNRPPARRKIIRQKAKIKTDQGERTIYLDLHDDEQPLELFVQVKGTSLDAEKIALYNCLACAYSLALQYGAPLEKIGEQLLGVKVAPAGPVVGDERIKNCQSPLDYIGRCILVWYCGRNDLAHINPDDPGNKT